MDVSDQSALTVNVVKDDVGERCQKLFQDFLEEWVLRGVKTKMQPAGRTQPIAVIGWQASRDKFGQSRLHFSRNVLFCSHCQPEICSAYCVVAVITKMQPAENDTMPVLVVFTDVQ